MFHFYINEDFKKKLKVDEILNPDREEIVKMTSNISKTLKEEFDKARNEGMQEGIEQGKCDLLIKQLTKKFNILSQEYVVKIKQLSDEKLEQIGESIFDITTISDLDKYLN